MPGPGLAAIVDTRKEFADLARLYLPIAGVVFLVVTGLLLAFVARYRQERDGPPAAATAPRIELAYAAVLALVVALLVGATFRTESRVDAVSADPGLVVDVTAAQWSWRFHYPRSGITRVGPFQSPATLVVPANTRVEIRLRSSDVIHAFYIPALRFKRDAFPDRTTRFDLDFGPPGAHPGACAEFCGLNHADMTFSVQVLAPARFAAWARREASR